MYLAALIALPLCVLQHALYLLIISHVNQFISFGILAVGVSTLRYKVLHFSTVKSLISTPGQYGKLATAKTIWRFGELDLETFGEHGWRSG